MRIIITGVTGMVGEGVLLECLENEAVEKVLAVSRKPPDHTHPKLEQLLIPDFRSVGRRSRCSRSPTSPRWPGARRGGSCPSACPWPARR